MIDSSGNCVATYRYSAFGEEQTQGAILSPWRYAGKRIDVETGFIYFGERYYDPSTLCWLTSDPLEDADGPNLYAYVHNNPLFYVDPDGCFSFGCINLDWTTLVTIAAEAALVTTVVGWGLAGVAEGFMAGCSGGITGTFIDLAVDAAALYGEGGAAAACATAESSTIAYNVCKTVGRLAGAAFSCTPPGKVTQAVVGTAKMGINAVKGAATIAQAANTGMKAAKTGGTIAAKGQKLLNFTPKIVEGNKKFGLKHIVKRHDFTTKANDVSKFLEGMGKKEISGLVHDACKNTKSWNIAENGFRTAVVDMGKTIGTNNNGVSTSYLRVVLNGDMLHTTYPF